MEHILKLISERSLDLNHKLLADHSLLVLDTIETQKVSLAFKGWQIREKCVEILTDCLDSKDELLRRISLNGFEALVINPVLEGGTGESELDKTDLRLFSQQILDALFNIYSLSNEERLIGIKIILRLCCNFGFALDKSLTLKTVQMCIKSCSDQQIQSDIYCAVESLVNQVLIDKPSNNDEINRKEFLCSAIGLSSFFLHDFKDRNHSLVQCSLTLECIYTIVKTFQPTQAKNHKLLPDYIRVDLIPCLMSINNSLVSNQKINFKRNKSFKSSDKHSNLHQHAAMNVLRQKIVLIAVELARFGCCVSLLRKHLCWLFAHLLSPLARHKFRISYSSLQQMWKSPEVLFDLIGPCVREDRRSPLINLTLLLQLIINVIMISSEEEVDEDRHLSVVICINSLCSTLLRLDVDSEDVDLRSDQIEMISNISDPKQLSSQDLLNDDRSNSDTEVASDSCGDNWMSTEDIYSISSPSYFSAIEDENELDLGKNNSGLPNKISELLEYVSGKQKRRYQYNQTVSPSTDNDNTQHEDLKSSDTSLENKKFESSDVDDTHSLMVEYDSQNPKLNSLKEKIFSQQHFQRLQMIVPDLVMMNDILEIDQTLREATTNLVTEISDSFDGDDRVFHVTSLYSLFYHIMFFTLKLKTCGHYYNAKASNVPYSKESWVELLLSSGIYLTSGWLRETYDHIISTDVFRRASVTSVTASHLVQVLQDMEPVNDSNLNEICESATNLSISSSHSAKAARYVAVNTLKVIWIPFCEVWNRYINGFVDGLFTVTTKHEECFKLSLGGLACASKKALQLGFLDKAKQGFEIISKALFGLKGSPIDFRGFSLISAICAEVIIDSSIELAQNSSSLWTYFFSVIVGLTPFLQGSSQKFDYDTIDPTLSVTDLLKIHYENFSLQDCLVTPTNSSRHVIMTLNCRKEVIGLLIGKIKRVFSTLFASLNLDRLDKFLHQFIKENERILAIAKKEKVDSTKVTSLMRCLVTCYAAAARKLPLLHITLVLRHISPFLIQTSSHEAPRVGVTSAACLCDVTASSLRTEHSHFRLNFWLFRSLHHSVQMGGRSHQVQNVISECIRDFVLKLPAQIKSGWSAIFALMSMNQNIFLIQRQDERSISSCVFESYLSVAFSDPDILTRFAFDFCHCLLKMYQNKISSHQNILCYIEQVHNLLIKLYLQKQIDRSDEVSYPFFKINVMENFSCAWKCPEDNLAQKLLHRSKRLFLGEKKEKTRLKYPEENEKKKFDRSFTTMNNYCEKRQPHILSLIYRITDLIVENSFVDNDQERLSEFLPQFIDKQNSSLGYNYILRFILNCIFPVFIKTAVQVTKKESNVCESYKGVVGTSLELFCNIIKNCMKNGNHHPTDTTNCIIYRFWVTYLNFCVFLVQTKHKVLSRLGCACLRLSITTLSSLMTSNMMLDVNDCLCYIINECLLSLNELILIGGLSEEDKARLTVEYTEEICSNSEWPPLFWKIFQSSDLISNVNKPKRQTKKCLIGCKLSQNYSNLMPESLSRISLDSLVCDISSLFLLLQLSSKMLFGDGLEYWREFSNMEVEDSDTSLHDNDMTSSTLHSSNKDDLHVQQQSDKLEASFRNDVIPLVAKLPAKQILELINTCGKIYTASREFNKKLEMRRIIQKAYSFHHLANLNQLSCVSFECYSRMVTSLCCRSSTRVPRVYPPIIDKLFLSPEGLDDEDTAWSFRLLHMAVCEIINPWDEDPSLYSIIPKPKQSRDNSSDDDTIQVDADYMAYVKKKAAEETSTRDVKCKSNSKGNSKSSMNKLLDFARSQKNLNVNGKLLEDDEKLIEREVWSTTITGFINLVMQSNDELFNRLIAVVYEPLTELIQSGKLLTSLSYTNCAHIRLDVAYRQLLVRVGKLKDFSKSSN